MSLTLSVQLLMLPAKGALWLNSDWPCRRAQTRTHWMRMAWQIPFSMLRVGIAGLKLACQLTDPVTDPHLHSRR